MKYLIPIFLTTIIFSACTDESRKRLTDLSTVCETMIINVTTEVGDVTNIKTCEDGIPCNLRDAIYTASQALCSEEDITIILELPTSATFEIADGEEAGPTVFSQPVFTGLNIESINLATKANIVINGNESTIKLSENNQGNSPDHLIYISDQSNVVLNNLIFETGPILYEDWSSFTPGSRLYNHAGGAIHSNGEVTLNNCTFQNCHAEFGGAIFNSGPMIIQDCLLKNNQGQIEPDVVDSYGGAICNQGQGANLDIRNCIIENNTSTRSAAFYNTDGAKLKIKDSTIKNNFSIEDEGVCYNETHGDIQVFNCDFQNNVPYALDNRGTMIVHNSEIHSTLLQLGRPMLAVKSTNDLELINTNIFDFDVVKSESSALLDFSGNVKIEDCIINHNKSTGNLLSSTGTGVFELYRSYFIENNIVQLGEISAPTVFFERNSFLYNNAQGFDMKNAENIRMVNNSFSFNESTNETAACKIFGSNTNLYFLHNTIMDNAVESEFGRHELIFTGTYNFVQMRNNIIFKKENSNGALSFPDAFSTSFDIDYNFLDVETEVLPNQYFINPLQTEVGINLNIGEVNQSIAFALIPEEFHLSCPKLSDVSVDITGSTLASDWVDPGCMIQF